MGLGEGWPSATKDVKPYYDKVEINLLASLAEEGFTTNRMAFSFHLPTTRLTPFFLQQIKKRTDKSRYRMIPLDYAMADPAIITSEVFAFSVHMYPSFVRPMLNFFSRNLPFASGMKKVK